CPFAWSHRQTCAPGLALVSLANPAATSFVAIFWAAAPFRLGGATMQRSSRCAAALSMTSCVSVSLMDMVLPFVSGSSAYPAPHQDEPRIDAIDGAKGCPPVILDPAVVHIHALFRRERQSFLHADALIPRAR